MENPDSDICPRVVFDCMIFLQGLVREAGPAADCLQRFEDGSVRLFVSMEILAEIRDVLTRPKLQRKFPRLTIERVEALLAGLLVKAEILDNVESIFHYERDPKDEPYINLAIAASASYLASRDNDLLDLMIEKRRDGQEFRQRFPGIHILDPVAFLRAILR